MVYIIINIMKCDFVQVEIPQIELDSARKEIRI